MLEFPRRFASSLGGIELMKEMVTFHFQAKKENVRIVRAIVRNFLLLKGVFEQDIFDTELAVDEAVANVIEHTYKCDESKFIIFTMMWWQGQLEVLLRDFGPKVDPNKVRPRPLEEVREGGLGVYIIQKIFDEMRWRDIGEEVGNLLYLRKVYKIPEREQ